MHQPFTHIQSDLSLPPEIADVAAWVPLLEVSIEANGRVTPLMFAVIDSGSPYCIFRAGIARFLSIDVEKGTLGTVYGASERIELPVYFHTVRLRLGSLGEFEITAGFVEGLAFPAILGMAGFFENFQVSFDHSGHPPSVEIQRIVRRAGVG